jgi:hypothetical protein
MKQDLLILSVSLGMNALSIFIYFKYLEKTYKKNYVQHDPLNKQIIDMPIISKNCCSWWPISHFILFAIYSFICPQYSWILFLYGVLWEVLEGIMNTMETKKGENVKHQQTRKGDKVEYVTWWEASYKDVLFNSVGIVVGRTLRQLYS